MTEEKPSMEELERMFDEGVDVANTRTTAPRGR